jgi:hypothetical protein
MVMKIRIETPAESLQKRHRSRLHLLSLSTALDGLVDVKLCDRGADNAMHLRGQVPRGRGPRAQRHRHGHHPLARRHPGHDALDRVRCGLGHAPARTGGAKAPPLIAEGQQDLLLAGVTSQAQQPVGQDAALEILVKLTLHIRGQACGIGIVMERGKQRLQVFCDHLREHGAARLPWFVGGGSRHHESTHVQYRSCERDRNATHYTVRMFSIQGDGGKTNARRRPLTLAA